MNGVAHSSRRPLAPAFSVRRVDIGIVIPPAMKAAIPILGVIGSSPCAIVLMTFAVMRIENSIAARAVPFICLIVSGYLSPQYFVAPQIYAFP